MNMYMCINEHVLRDHVVNANPEFSNSPLRRRPSFLGQSQQVNTSSFWGSKDGKGLDLLKPWFRSISFVILQRWWHCCCNSTPEIVRNETKQGSVLRGVSRLIWPWFVFSPRYIIIHLSFLSSFYQHFRKPIYNTSLWKSFMFYHHKWWIFWASPRWEKSSSSSRGSGVIDLAAKDGVAAAGLFVWDGRCEFIIPVIIHGKLT